MGCVEIRDSRKGVRVWLGTYNNVEEAARAYDREAHKICYKRAKVNFPNKDEDRYIQARRNPPHAPHHFDGALRSLNLEFSYDLNQAEATSSSWGRASGPESGYSTMKFLESNQRKGSEGGKTKVAVEREEENHVGELSEELMAYENYMKTRWVICEA